MARTKWFYQPERSSVNLTSDQRTEQLLADYTLRSRQEFPVLKLRLGEFVINLSSQWMELTALSLPASASVNTEPVVFV